MSTDNLQYQSAFHIYRQQYQPRVPSVLNAAELKSKFFAVPVSEEIKQLFPSLCQTLPQACTFEVETSNTNASQPNPLKIGCVLSGGQAAGGHNVIVGIYEYIKKRNSNSQLFGFLNGPIGIIKGNYVQLNDQIISFYKNSGGFHMIRSGRNKIEKPEEFESSLNVCKKLDLDGLVVIGGDDSNTNACLLAEYFKKNNCKTKVIGCPKTIDGDLKNEFIEVSFGFDTACKTYSELIGNIMYDTVTTKRFYHFIRLMGRSASHITLECSLLTRPNYSFIGEEIEQKKVTLSQLVDELVEIIVQRSQQQKNYGVVLVPEGLIEFIGEVKVLISEINNVLAKELKDAKLETNELFNSVCQLLTPSSATLLKYLPRKISEQLLLDRDPHGNVQVAKIETEKLLIDLCVSELKKKTLLKQYDGIFQTQSHYFGYEGRCAFPSNFDCEYCYCLGLNAAILIEKGFTGAMSCIRNLSEEPQNWVPSSIPLVTMMHTEIRKGVPKPVIEKALTRLEGSLFKLYEANRKSWAYDDVYLSIGPLQYEFKCQTPYLVQAPTQSQLYKNANFCKEKLIMKNSQQVYFPIQDISDLNIFRSQQIPKIPTVLANNKFKICKDSTPLSFNCPEINSKCQSRFPLIYQQSNQLISIISEGSSTQTNQECQQSDSRNLKIGICFNGRNAPGVHNCIEGLFRFCQNNGYRLYGFLNGVEGFLREEYIEIDYNLLQPYINQGGEQMLGRSQDKIRSKEDLERAKGTCYNLNLEGIVFVGASHTLTDSLILAEYFLQEKVNTKVIAIPATINNNISHPNLEICIGFDSATKLYSQLIGNMLIDAASAVKYFYFIRLMSSGPSYVALECALQTNPNYVLIGEDIQRKGWGLNDIVNFIADLVIQRSNAKKDYGTILIPEGLLTHIPDFQMLISELNSFFQKIGSRDYEYALERLLKQNGYINQIISAQSAARFLTLPDFIQKQLLKQRNPSGELSLTEIETERLIVYLVEQELKERKKKGQFNGTFSPVCSFFGFQGRSAAPTLFDCELASTYGFISGALIGAGITGYCVSSRGVVDRVEDWQALAIPLINMTSIKTTVAYGSQKPIIASSQIDVEKSKAFYQLQQKMNNWMINDCYISPGPTQFFGERSCDKALTLKFDQENCNRLSKI